MRAGVHFMPDTAASLLSESCLSPVCENTSGCATSCLAACEDVFLIHGFFQAMRSGEFSLTWEPLSQKSGLEKTMVSVASFVTFPHSRDKEWLGHIIIHTNDNILNDKSHMQVRTLSSAREVRCKQKF